MESEILNYINQYKMDIFLYSGIALSVSALVCTIRKVIKDAPKLRKEREQKISELEENIENMSSEQKTKFIKNIVFKESLYNEDLDDYLKLSKDI